jgi:hypothetical protein
MFCIFFIQIPLRSGLNQKIAKKYPHFSRSRLQRTETNELISVSDQEWIRIREDNRKCEGISCFEVLDVSFLGLKISPVAWTSFIEA